MVEAGDAVAELHVPPAPAPRLARKRDGNTEHRGAETGGWGSKRASGHVLPIAQRLDDGQMGAVDNRQVRAEALAAMDKEPRLLILWHSRTGASEALARAAAEGAGTAAWLVGAGAAEPEMLLAADGYLFVCPENLGSMSGLMKEAFDRSYYPLLGKVEGRPYATLIAAGSDGEGAQRQIDRIATGWRLKRVAPPVIVNLAAQTAEAIIAPKTVPEAALVQARETGAALAEGLRLGLF